MASVRWTGNAQAIAQIDTITVAGAWATNDTVTLTINDKDLVITIGEASPTTTTVALAIKEAWENDTFTDATNSKTPAGGGQDIAEMAEITATASGAVVTLTHDTPGRPFTLTATEVTATTGTATEATATAGTGPNHWDNADNWDTGSVPVSTDDVFIDNSDTSILYGLNQSAVALTSLNILKNFTGDIGLPKRNTGGYVEYRGDYLQITGTTFVIGRGPGSGSNRLKIDCGSGVTLVLVEGTGSPAESGLSALLLKGTITTLTVMDGSVGVAQHGEDTSAVTTINVGGGSLHLGVGSSLTTVNNQGGSLELFSNTTTLVMDGGEVSVGAAATVGTLTVTSGDVEYLSTGTITTLNLGGASSDSVFRAVNSTGRTITTCTISSNGRIEDPSQSITYTNGIAIGSDVNRIIAE